MPGGAIVWDDEDGADPRLVPFGVGGPGRPLKVINPARAAAMGISNTRGTSVGIARMSQAITYYNDSTKAFFPFTAQAFNELNEWHQIQVPGQPPLTATHLEQAIISLQSDPGHAATLVNKIHPGLLQFLRGNIRTSQNARLLFGPIVNIETLTEEDVNTMDRTSYMGFSNARDQMIAILQAALLFDGMELKQDGGNFKVIVQGKPNPLVEGVVDVEHETTSWKIPTTTDPADRHRAIIAMAHLILMHRQNNGSNVVVVNHEPGGNPLETMVFIKELLCVGHAHVVISGAVYNAVSTAIATGPYADDQKAELTKAWNHLVQYADIYSRRSAQLFNADKPGGWPPEIGNFNHLFRGKASLEKKLTELSGEIDAVTLQQRAPRPMPHI